jgi:uridine kinase
LPKIIAVSGGSGSGKTTVVEMLRRHCVTQGSEQGILVLQMDNYYHDLAGVIPSERDKQNFDQPQSFDTKLLYTQLGQLLKGEAIDQPIYDFATHTRMSKTTRVTPQPVILFDGFLTLADERIRTLFDLSIYVDVSDDVRFIRRLKRDTVERGRTVDGVISQYLATVKPMHDLYVEPQRKVADVIINWESYNHRAIAMLGNMIKAIVGSP